MFIATSAGANHADPRGSTASRRPGTSPRGRWYATHCDGDWEHAYGIRIRTLDNPGWKIEVDLSGTALESFPFAMVGVDRDDGAWLHLRVEGTVWTAYCDPLGLDAAIATFLAWARDP